IIERAPQPSFPGSVVLGPSMRGSSENTLVSGSTPVAQHRVSPGRDVVCLLPQPSFVPFSAALHLIAIPLIRSHETRLHIQKPPCRDLQVCSAGCIFPIP